MVVADVRGEGGDGDGDVCFARALRLIAISPGAHKINFVQWNSSTSESGKLTDFSPGFDKWCSAPVTHAVADTNIQHVSVLFCPILGWSSLFYHYSSPYLRSPTKMERKTFSLPTLMMGSDRIWTRVANDKPQKEDDTTGAEKAAFETHLSWSHEHDVVSSPPTRLKKILISSFYSFVSWRETRKSERAKRELNCMNIRTIR